MKLPGEAVTVTMMRDVVFVAVDRVVDDEVGKDVVSATAVVCDVVVDDKRVAEAMEAEDEEEVDEVAAATVEEEEEEEVGDVTATEVVVVVLDVVAALEAAELVLDGAADEDEALEPPVGTSPALTHPVLAVKTAGHSTCTKLTVGLSAPSNQS